VNESELSEGVIEVFDSDIGGLDDLVDSFVKMLDGDSTTKNEDTFEHEPSGFDELVDSFVLMMENDDVSPPSSPVADSSIEDVIKKGDVVALQNLLKSGSQTPVDDQSGFSHLYRAALHGHEDCTKMLLEKQLQSAGDKSPNDSWEVLLYSARCQAGDCAKVLSGIQRYSNNSAPHSIANLANGTFKIFARYTPHTDPLKNTTKSEITRAGESAQNILLT